MSVDGFVRDTMLWYFSYLESARFVSAMLNKLSTLLATSLLISFSVCYADNIGKVSVDETVTCSGQTLSLNGAGVRKKLFIKLYVATLYTQTKSSDEQQLLSMNQPLCIRLHITSAKITSEKLVKATREGFDKSTQGNTTVIAEEIESFLTWLNKPIKKGDVFEFSFLPDDKTQTSKNNQLLGEINNKKFASALFGIWLGSNPVQLDLKNELLGN